MEIVGPGSQSPLRPGHEIRTSERENARIDGRHADLPASHLGGIPDGDTHIPASELQTLQNKLSESAEDRSELISGVREKLAAGTYLTTGAAEQTARSILGRFGNGVQ